MILQWFSALPPSEVQKCLAFLDINIIAISAISLEIAVDEQRRVLLKWVLYLCVKTGRRGGKIAKRATYSITSTLDKLQYVICSCLRRALADVGRCIMAGQLHPPYSTPQKED